MVKTLVLHFKKRKDLRYWGFPIYYTNPTILNFSDRKITRVHHRCITVDSFFSAIYNTHLFVCKMLRAGISVSARVKVIFNRQNFVKRQKVMCSGLNIKISEFFSFTFTIRWVSERSFLSFLVNLEFYNLCILYMLSRKFANTNNHKIVELWHLMFCL